MGEWRDPDVEAVRKDRSLVCPLSLHPAPSIKACAGPVRMLAKCEPAVLPLDVFSVWGIRRGRAGPAGLAAQDLPISQ